MKTLLILRHAKSSWDNARLADHDRPLKARGKQDAPKMGRLLRRLDLTPDLIISSTARRAHDTAELVSEACGYEEEVLLTEDFYHAGPEEYIEVLLQLPDTLTRVMVVGHNPGLEMLLETLTEDWERLPTAALAEVALPIAHWAELTEATSGALRQLWCPREVEE